MFTKCKNFIDTVLIVYRGFLLQRCGNYYNFIAQEALKGRDIPWGQRCLVERYKNALYITVINIMIYFVFSLNHIEVFLHNR